MKKVTLSLYHISVASLLEARKKRIVLIVLIISFLLLLMNLSCESVMIQANGKEIEDASFGFSFVFMLVSFWNIILSLLITSSMISEELENKTYIMVISKPIYRISYFAGKCLGVFLLCVLNTIIVISIYTVLKEFKTGVWNFELYLAFLYLIPSSLVLILSVGFFSVLLNRTVSLLINFFLIISSLMINFPIYEVSEEAMKQVFKDNSAKEFLLQASYWILPQFGTNFLYSSSKVLKSLAQTHNLGIYSIIQLSIWFLIIWILFYFTTRNKELG
jgi:ABC-type transport system involved in multi-copper enzyme maturation permease subunit